MIRVAPAERGRPRDVLAYIDVIEADHMRSWALSFPLLGGEGRLRILRADQLEVLNIATNLLRAAVHVSAVERGHV